MDFKGHPQLKFWEEGAAHHLDVRPMLEAGGEPYPHIMDLVGQLRNGEKLVVHALFEPKPLIGVLQRMEKNVSAARVGEEHWELLIENPG